MRGTGGMWEDDAGPVGSHACELSAELSWWRITRLGVGRKEEWCENLPWETPQRSPEGKSQTSPRLSHGKFHGSPELESAQKQVPGPQSSPGVASEMWQTRSELKPVCLKGEAKFCGFLSTFRGK